MATQRERFELSRSTFAKALARLHEALRADESDLTRDALIQRFEFTYGLAWKAMFRWLLCEGENVPELPRAVLRAAFRGRLIGDPELWERIKDYRSKTSHTYNDKLAIEVAAFVATQATDAFDDLLAKLAAA